MITESGSGKWAATSANFGASCWAICTRTAAVVFFWKGSLPLRR